MGIFFKKGDHTRQEMTKFLRENFENLFQGSWMDREESSEVKVHLYVICSQNSQSLIKNSSAFFFKIKEISF